jgi:hypothetical protein
MSTDSQLVENIEAFLKPRIASGGDWCWEEVLALAVRYEWKVFEEDAPLQPVTRLHWTGHFKGTGNKAWDDVIRTAGEKVHLTENPPGDPYRSSRYASDRSKRELARRMAQILIEEVTRAGLP